ncbi:MAG TPA: alpha/beta hydrolase [Actinomycetota bacterium]|nr:alpha/beta hydrolase [Actinomycetota bacterium]
MQINGIELHVVDEGVGTPVVLLHGFPDSSYLWRHQVAALTGAGFRTVAPDLRGFGASSKPQDVESYQLQHILADVVAMMDELQIERAHVVGHDWGAFAAWMLAAFFPHRVDRLVAVSVGHPSTFGSLPVEQNEKSWYMLLFQFAEAEQLLQANDWALLRKLLRECGDFERYIRDLSRPGALTAALNWYRALVHPRMRLAAMPSLPKVAAPAMGIWSDGDYHLIEDGMKDSGKHVTGPWRYERIDGASHWVPVDAPERLNELLLKFLAKE